MDDIERRLTQFEIKHELLQQSLNSLIDLKKLDHVDLNRMHEQNSQLLQRLSDRIDAVAQTVHDHGLVIYWAKWVVVTGGGVVVVGAINAISEWIGKVHG